VQRYSGGGVGAVEGGGGGKRAVSTPSFNLSRARRPTAIVFNNTS